MGTRKYNPTSPGRRFQTVSDFAEMTTDKPEKRLTKALKKTGGRNNRGRITMRHRGGGSRRGYREIDFMRNKFDIPAKVASIEYDPNRSSRIALLHYLDGEKRYILWPVGLSVGDKVVSGEAVEIQVGNAMPLRSIPLGTFIHNIELRRHEAGAKRRRPGPARSEGRKIQPRQARKRRGEADPHRLHGHSGPGGQRGT